MALSIKNEETVRLARQLSETTGESITTAIRVALEERLTRVGRQRPGSAAKDRAARLTEIVRRLDALPRLDTRSEDEILDYNQHGLPE